LIIKGTPMTRPFTLLLSVALAFLAGCHEAVLTARPEDEANTALAALSRSGVGARKVDAGRGSFDVRVPARDFERSLEILEGVGLPRAKEPGLAELFPEPGLVPSATEERVRYHRALAGELGASLRRLSGVREARVHLALPMEQPRRLDRAPVVPAKASVLILAEPGRHGELEIRAYAMRQLVAGAVVGLEVEDVSVVVTEAAPLPPSPARAEYPGLPRPALLAGGVGTLLAGLLLVGALLIRRRPAIEEAG
jgi:type III secretion protein J